MPFWVLLSVTVTSIRWGSEQSQGGYGLSAETLINEERVQG